MLLKFLYLPQNNGKKDEKSIIDFTKDAQKIMPNI
jgi:hypothetical protein